MEDVRFKKTEIGVIPEHWDVSSVGKVGKVITGKTPPTNNHEYYGDDYPFVRIPDMVNSVYIKKTNTRISQKGANYLGKIKLPKNSIMVSCIATIGNVGITSEESFTNQQINSLIPNPHIADFKYLYYFFKNNKELLESLGGGGSVYSNISKSKFENMLVVLPNVMEQKQIAEILSSLDDKIELNRKINSNLEKLASLLFKQWVVDSEQKIKDGCKIGKVSDLIRVESGFPFHSSMFDDGGDYKLVTIKNVQDGFFVPDCTDSLSEIPTKVPTHCRLNNGDILLSLTGNVGRVCFVYGENYLLNQRVANLVPIDENNRAFIYFLFRQKDFQNTLIGISRGTAQQNLSPIETKSLEITIPSQDALDRFANVANPIFQKLVENYNEIKNLSLLRDSLLPRLMNGKIRVK